LDHSFEKESEVHEPREGRPSARVNKPIPPALFAHVVVKTRQIDEIIRWYETVLGAHVVFRNNIICFMTYDHEHHRIAFIQVPENTDIPRGSGAVDHFAYSYRHLGELLSTYYRLREHGILPVRMINHGPTISFYYRDPDRLMLELQVDNFDTLEETTAFFQSEEFAENPIGVFVDPDNLRAAWEAGVSWEEIRRRPPLPEGKTVADMRVENVH
jgi:catechol 2,3-dioxygenase-like lactoylglutathione lyase family enzyme